MRKIFTLLYIIAAFFAKADSWTQKADFPGTPREDVFSFSIGNKGYIGCGLDTATPVIAPLHFNKDFWEYDPSTNAWTQIADFGGNERGNGASFSIGNKGYAGMGADSNIVIYDDLWEYNPLTNIWTQKTSIPGIRAFPISFSINGNGYVGTGNSFATLYNDLWEYNPVFDIWTQKANLPAGAREEAVGFSIGNKGYIQGGVTGGWGSDFWEYDPASDSWTQKTNFPPAKRGDHAAFSIGNYGYLGFGEFQQVDFWKDWWQYDPVLDQWTQKTSPGGFKRDELAFFSINCKGYIGTGGAGVNGLLKDFWEYTPDSACTTGIEELPTSNLEFTISPNPAKEFTICSFQFAGNKKIELTVTDVNGKKVYEAIALTSDFRLPVSSLQSGIYFVEASPDGSGGKQKAVKKFLKE
jgi:N-acetylneuraminic acid mutarotase